MEACEGPSGARLHVEAKLGEFTYGVCDLGSGPHMHLLNALRAMLMRSSRMFVWSTTTLGLFVLFSVFAAIGYDSYLGTLQINEQAAMNIAALAGQDVARNIELYDLSLQAVIEGMNDPDVMRLQPRLRQKALFETSATAQGLGALVVLDESGSIVLDSRSAFPRLGTFIAIPRRASDFMRAALSARDCRGASGASRSAGGSTGPTAASAG
jgi:hypothetical protein